jgi:hypothetical protein
VQFYEWLLHKVHEVEKFVSELVWSDEATLEKLGEEIKKSRAVITVNTLATVASAPVRRTQSVLANGGQFEHSF